MIVGEGEVVDVLETPVVAVVVDVEDGTVEVETVFVVVITVLSENFFCCVVKLKMLTVFPFKLKRIIKVISLFPLASKTSL